jgi:type II secretory pathway predicted ATPase ExeA
MGKTSLLLEALNELREERKVVFLFQTISSPLELIRAILIDLEVVDPQGSLVDLQTKLNEVLVSLAATGKTLVVFIDEAQHLGEPTFEFVRMLSNFETASSKLMQIVLCGQPQLMDVLNSSSLLQLRQRVSIFARLDGLSSSETRSYIEHRVRVAGLSPDAELFTEPAIALIVQHSDGIPRNINNICFNALSLAYALRRSRVESDLIREVIQDLGIDPSQKSLVIAQKPEVRRLGSSTYGSHGVRWAGSQGIRISALCLAFFCFIAFVLGYKQAQSTGAPVQGTSELRRVVFAAPQLSTSTPAQGLESRTQSLPIRAGQNLYSICKEVYGVCSPEMLRDVIKNNPSLGNPRRIKPGSMVRIQIPSTVPIGSRSHSR